MPSNAMKASQAAAKLAALIEHHGDLDVVLVSGAIIAIDGRNVMVTNEINGQKLARPVIAFGVTVDDRGRQRSFPGDVYQKTVTPDGWTYDRDAAPENAELIVWKRIGGKDRGYRRGEKWFVHEGGDRAWECVPSGILGWRLP